MNQNDTMKLLAGMAQIARQTKNILKEKTSHFLEDEILQGNYPSREEFEQLKALVDKIQQDIDKLAKK